HHPCWAREIVPNIFMPLLCPSSRLEQPDQSDHKARYSMPLPRTVPVGAGAGLSGVGFLGADRHIRRGGSGVDVGRGRLRRPRPVTVLAFPLLPVRRQRPYPASSQPPPLPIQSHFLG